MSDPAAAIPPPKADPPPPGTDEKAKAPGAAPPPKDGPPPPPKGTPLPRNPAGSRSYGANVSANRIENSTINTTVNAMFEGLETTRVTVFSVSGMSKVLDAAGESTNAALFVYEPPFVEQCLRTLRQHRLLFLIDEADRGKASMARYLACQLQSDGSLTDDTLLFSPLASDVRGGLHSELCKNPELSGRTILFPDIAERGNSEVREFLKGLKGDDAASLGRELALRNSYLIMTATPGSLPPDCIAAFPGWLRPTMTPLSSERLRQGLDQRIEWLLSQNPERTQLSTVTDELKQRILKWAGTLSRAVLFLQAHLLRVLRGEISLETAFEEADGVVSWFKTGPSADTEAWIYALSLTLAHTTRDNVVPWTTFVELYQTTRECLSPRRIPERLGQLPDEEALRRKVGAVVERHLSEPQDLIRFENSGVAGLLWQVLLTRYRSVIYRLAPALEQLAKSDHFGPRIHAAQALGRIGSLDARLTRAWIDEWSPSDEWSERALVGHLSVGALSCGDDRYREFVLGRLDACAEGNLAQTWTAIAAYKEIGTREIGLAMKKLQAIAKSALAPAFAASRELDQRLDQLRRTLDGDNSSGAQEVSNILEVLTEFYKASLEERVEIADSLAFALTSLALKVGLKDVLTALDSWAISSEGMGAVVFLVFLRDGGIASEISRRKQDVVLHSPTGPVKVSCNAAVASLLGSQSDQSAIRTMVRFLETLYAVVTQFFPMVGASQVLQSLFKHLTTWTRESLETPACRTAMVALVGNLMNSRLTELSHRTIQWLSTDAAFSQGEMARFASEARRFSLTSH